MALLNLGNSSGGLLSRFFGPAANNDPLGQFMGTQYYDPNEARAEGISEALKAASRQLLYRGPPRGGDLTTLGNAFSDAGTAYKQAKTDYLAKGASKYLTQKEMERKKREDDKEIAHDNNMADFVAGLPPDVQKMVQNDPLMADMVAKQWADSLYPSKHDYGGSDFAQGNIVSLGTWEDGKTPKYGQWQPSYKSGVPPRLEVMPKGTEPQWGPGPQGSKAEATTTGKTTSDKKSAAESVKFAAQSAQASIKSLIADPNLDYYAGYTGKFGEQVFSMPEYIGIEAKIQPLLSAQFKAFMNESGVHSQISDQDRVAMSALIAQIRPGMPKEQLISSLKAIDGYFDSILARNEKYLEEVPNEEGAPDVSKMTAEELIEYWRKKK